VTRIKHVLAMALLATTALASDHLHVTSIHKATRDDEKTYHTGFNQNIIIGTVGNRRYTLEQLASWFFYHFEVGQDYEVIKADDKVVKVKVVDKKGHGDTERLNVVTVEEIEAK
jgi:hypothetical protein